MLAILGGLGAALFWGTSTLAASRSSRILPGASVLAWVSLTGLALAVPVAVVGPNPGPRLADLPLLVLSGGGGAIGLLVAYAALRIGRVSIVAPIVSTEGAIAAMLAVIAGDAVGPGVGVAMGAVAVGVALASWERSGPAAAAPATDPVVVAAPSRARRAALLAVLAAGCFGLSLWATGRVGATLSMGWALLPARIAGGLALGPLIARRSLRRPGRAAPFVVLGGVCEVLGTVSFIVGASAGPAVASVLAAQFAAVVVGGAWLLFRERPDRVQLTGIGILIAGTTAIAVLRA